MNLFFFISYKYFHSAQLTWERQHTPYFLCMLNFVDLFSKVPPNKMLGHFTLHWTSVKNVEKKKVGNLCTNYVWIYLIASTQGICLISVLVTIWCSNNFPSMKCTHVNFWYPDIVFESPPPILCYFSSIFSLSVLSSVGIVMHALLYFFVLVYFWWMFLGFCLQMFECLCIQYVFFFSFSFFFFCCSSPIHSFTIILLTELLQFA